MKKVFIMMAMVLATMAIFAQQWPEVKPEAKAGARWWWLGSAVDKENLRWTMEQYAGHGIGALEITPIYGVQGNQANNIPYLSDRWMEMLREVQQNGRDLGIEVDMSTGTGWPFGGPWVPLEESACKAVFVDTTFVGGTVENFDLSAPEKERPYCRLNKVMAYWQGRPYDVTAYVSEGRLTWSPAEELKTRIASASNKSLRKTLKLELKEMANAHWEVVAVWLRHGVMKVKRAAPGGEGLGIDHFDTDAGSHYLQHVEAGCARTGTP